ncbi:uncharacterized protein LOC114325538 [Diabrotica virgifera virgifera]|uniref:Uncharacterized protein LOC114325538 n=1 Tax=Diabrotica virgifera virgifera TaxID=50390 RepID=A0A6P7F7J8_DIAVI|nr:uncharacterized protein LOC114325538 [Diabrotica virgifera virgifera]
MNCRASCNPQAKHEERICKKFSSSYNNLDDFTRGSRNISQRNYNTQQNVLDNPIISSQRSPILAQHPISNNNIDTFDSFVKQRNPMSEHNQREFQIVDRPRHLETASNPTSNPASNPTRNTIGLSMTESTILHTLRSVRSPIVNYQESRGVPRNEQVSFINLITSLCTHAYTAVITILVMLWNLVPLLDGFVYFARFAVDKLINIFETRDSKEKIMKMAIFAGEIIVILFIIFLIIGLIFMPVYLLVARIISKIWGMIVW